jgi:hypothetical protein
MGCVNYLKGAGNDRSVSEGTIQGELVKRLLEHS